jgi:predicted DNA-binding transcriptional regulator YafY
VLYADLIGDVPPAWITSDMNTRTPRSRKPPPRGPRRSADTHIVRVLALLLAMARSRRGVLLKQFAEDRGYPLSAVYRDRDALRNAGVPIEEPDGGRYKVPDAWLPPAATGANREEMLALFVARRLAPGLRGTRVARHLDALWAKLASPGGQTPITFPDEVALSIPALAAIDYAPHAVVIDLLIAAQRERRAVWIRYRKANGDESERTVEPGFLHWDGRLETLYALTWCQLREAVRVFAVHRILDARTTDETFAPRHQTQRAALEKAFQIWVREQTHPVAVQFSARVAGEIRERRRHATQRLDELEDGGLVWYVEVAEPEELTRWILGYGPDARVLAPAHLADRVRLRHREAADVPDASGAPESMTPARRRGLKSSRSGDEALPAAGQQRRR